MSHLGRSSNESLRLKSVFLHLPNCLRKMPKYLLQMFKKIQIGHIRCMHWYFLHSMFITAKKSAFLYLTVFTRERSLEKVYTPQISAGDFCKNSSKFISFILQICKNRVFDAYSYILVQ